MPLNAQPLSLQQCQDYAIRHSLVIRQGELQVETARLTQRQTERAVWPTLAGSMSEALNLGRTIDPFSNGFVQKTIHSGSVGLSSNWSLFNGFRQHHQVQQQTYMRQADEAELMRQKQEVGQRVIGAYMQVLLSQQLAELAVSQRQTINRQRDRTKALIEEGQAATIQLTDWDAQLAAADYEVVSAGASLRQNSLLLQQLLNWQEAAPLTIQVIEVPEPAAPPAQPSDWIREGLRTQPMAQVAGWRLKSAQSGYAVARTSLLPAISVGGGVNTAYSSAAPRELFPIGRQLNYNLGQYVRLSVSLPVLNGLQARFQIARALIAKKTAEIDVQKVHLQLTQEIEQAVFAQTLAFEKWQSAQRQVEAQQKALLAGKARFDEGLIHVIEYATLQTNLNRALSNQLQARYEYYFRKLIADTYQN
ncbi:hypothetical protein BLX24_18380 [Arsenicibacter rosenii]|uniref:Transporter n=1 Tax=Arsenicibacter rosenii TaxID=1750698 RepID=A0A1S2VG54_9BACT|nr:hypothetical protein BLX24_18380 [Arsenicibacter rosenii]